MRKTREEKAITLIALIITIVVLLILAVVAINSVTGDGIIQHATNARDSYENAQAKEQDVLSYYETYLSTKGNVGPWKQEGDYITMTDSEGNQIKVPIGAKVNYNKHVAEKTYTSSYTVTGLDVGNDQTFTSSGDIEWYVMGEENGKVILISSKTIFPEELSSYKLYGKTGYNNSIEELNKICSIYDDGNYAETARSLALSDIENIAGISEANRKEIFSEYGNEFRYEYNFSTGTIWYYKNGGEGVEIGDRNIYFIDETLGVIDEENNIINDNSKEIINSRFCFEFSNIEINSKIEEILINGGTSWIATKSLYVLENSQTLKGHTRYGVSILDKDNENVRNGVLYNSNNSDQGITELLPAVRPIVILNKDVQLNKNADGATWDLSK